MGRPIVHSSVGLSIIIIVIILIVIIIISVVIIVVTKKNCIDVKNAAALVNQDTANQPTLDNDLPLSLMHYHHPIFSLSRSPGRAR